MSDVAVIAERLWSRTVVAPNGCFEWTGTTNLSGYGKIEINGKTRGTHRVAWEIENGSIPEGLQVLHKCDNRKCLNVQHLWLGTQKENMVDMSAKGRAGNQTKTHCIKGHPYDQTNTHFRSNGWRSCRTCSRVEAIGRYRAARDARVAV